MGPDLGSNCLQRLSADSKRHLSLTFISGYLIINSGEGTTVHLQRVYPVITAVPPEPCRHGCRCSREENTEAEGCDRKGTK